MAALPGAGQRDLREAIGGITTADRTMTARRVNPPVAAIVKPAIDSRAEVPLCQPRVRQLPLEIYVPMGGEWPTDRAQAKSCLSHQRLS